MDLRIFLRCNILQFLNALEIRFDLLFQPLLYLSKRNCFDWCFRSRYLYYSCCSWCILRLLLLWLCLHDWVWYILLVLVWIFDRKLIYNFIAFYLINSNFLELNYEIDTHLDISSFPPLLLAKSNTPSQIWLREIS